METREASQHVSSGKKRATLRRVFLVFGGVLLAIAVINVVLFAAGFRVGFFHRWVDDQYFGKISRVSDGGFVIVNQEGQEKVVLVLSVTLMREGRSVVGQDALQTGEYVMVLGSADDEGRIVAHVVRIFEHRW